MATRVNEGLVDTLLIALTLSLGLWIVHGVLRGDWVVISANTIGTTLAAIVLGCKIRDL